MTRIDLNADVGESFGAWRMGHDQDLLPLISSANIACGWHAGDPLVMQRTVQTAVACGLAIGAHPGYPDLLGFGRRSLAMSGEEVYAALLYQIGALRAIAEAAGARLGHVKPHGALYNDANRDPGLAKAVARAVKSAGGGLCLVGLPASRLAEAAADAGIGYWGEFFADRAYCDDGSLAPRGQPGAVLEDADQVIERCMVAVGQGRIRALSGTSIELDFKTICMHGDNPEAVALASSLRQALEAGGIAVLPVARED